MIQKKRRYYYPSPLAIDKFNTQVLRSLSVKLSRDYLGFFGQLEKMYQRGDLKKRLVKSVTQVNKSVSLLDSMIRTTNVTKEDVETLTANIDEINSDRDYYVEQAEKNASFQSKMMTVEETSGITPQSLNITKTLISKGAAQVRRRSREGAGAFRGCQRLSCS